MSIFMCEIGSANWCMQEFIEGRRDNNNNGLCNAVQITKIISDAVICVQMFGKRLYQEQQIYIAIWDV